MSLSDKIEELSTIQNAIEWSQEQDKYVFCVDLLEVSPWSPSADSAVDLLEDNFEELLEAA